jgi:hypothetical protein
MSLCALLGFFSLHMVWSQSDIQLRWSGEFSGFVGAIYHGDVSQWDSSGGADGNIRLQINASDWRLEFLGLLGASPEPWAKLEQARLRVRGDGIRLQTGWAKQDWGPGSILNYGNLLSIPGTSPFLVDVWAALDSEAYVQGVWQTLNDRLGARIGADISGVGLEGAWVWEYQQQIHQVAVSMQLHAGLDWYATGRLTVDDQERTLLGMIDGSAGAVGLFRLDELWNLSTRHEIAGGRGLLTSWHQISLNSEDSWTIQVQGDFNWLEFAANAQLVLMLELFHGIQTGLSLKMAFDSQGLDSDPGTMSVTFLIRTRWGQSTEL